MFFLPCVLLTATYVVQQYKRKLALFFIGIDF